MYMYPWELLLDAFEEMYPEACCYISYCKMLFFIFKINYD